MIVLHAYQHLHEPVVAAIRAQWPDAELVACESRWEPWETIRSVWGQDDLVLIEQHKLIHDGVRQAFENCASPWCLFPFELIHRGNFCYDGIGCVRFRRELQLDFTAQDVEDGYGSCWECGGVNDFFTKPPRPGCWRHLDGVFANLLPERGYSRCVHEPPVLHWEVYHGCEVT